MKSSPDTINATLARTFCILDQGFCIRINGTPVQEEEIDWEYTYPPGATLENMGKGRVAVDADDEDSAIEFQYRLNSIDPEAYFSYILSVALSGHRTKWLNSCHGM